MTDLHALIEKLEQATEEQPCDPDWLREVRTAIADACFDRAKPEAFDEPHWWAQGLIGWQALDDLPDWLFSIDAALTLKPSGWDFCISRGHDEHATVSLSPAKSASEVSASAPETAFAVCVACLKARARLLPTEAQP